MSASLKVAPPPPRPSTSILRACQHLASFQVFGGWKSSFSSLGFPKTVCSTCCTGKFLTRGQKVLNIVPANAGWGAALPPCRSLRGAVRFSNGLDFAVGSRDRISNVSNVWLCGEVLGRLFLYASVPEGLQGGRVPPSPCLPHPHPHPSIHMPVLKSWGSVTTPCRASGTWLEEHPADLSCL